MSEIVPFPMDRVRQSDRELSSGSIAEIIAISANLEERTEALSDRIDRALAEQGLSATGVFVPNDEIRSARLAKEKLRDKDWNGFTPA